METTLTRESASKVRLSVTATADEVAPALDRAVRDLGSQVKIPGFRQGKVPRKILEQRIGVDALQDATVREALPELLTRALEDQQELRPVSNPRVEQTDYELGGPISFEAIIDVRPDIELPSFELLTATRPVTQATEDEIGEQLERMQDRFSSLEAVERPAVDGDYVACDIHTTLHGTEIADLSGNDQLYPMGSAWPVEQMDAELAGKKTGDIVKFNATLPDGVGEYSGTEVTLQILVKEVRRKVTPALDDEFAKTASEFDTLDELKADLAERIEKVKAVQADGAVRDQILEQVLDDVEVEPPESLVLNEMAYRLQRFEEQLGQSGLNLEQYLQMQDVTEEQIEADLRRQAERNVRAQLILEEVGRSEGLQVSEDELRQEVQYHAEVMRQDAADLAKQLNEGGRVLALAGDIIRRKALNLLVEKADVKQEGDASDEAPAEESHDDA